MERDFLKKGKNKEELKNAYPAFQALLGAPNQPQKLCKKSIVELKKLKIWGSKLS